jgi:transcriptional antiterminator RfaH
VKNWYLIQTKPKQESIAKENLERQGYSVYLPMTVARRKRRGRSIRVIEAMFPRYLFIQLSDKTDDWAPIRSTIGVSTLVRFGITPAKIPQILIDALVVRENKDGIHELPEKYFERGKEVVISEGPFEGYEAIFTTYDANERVSLLLKIAGKTIKIQLKKDIVEPLS